MTEPVHLEPQSTPLRTGVVVLAAGFSRRYGGVKLRAPLRSGNTVLEQTLARITAASTNVIVVTRDALSDIKHSIIGLHGHNVRIAICPDSELGMGHTLAYGIAQIKDWDACLVCLGDMPFIKTQTYTTLLNALSKEHILMPQYKGQSGHPVGFGMRYFPALRALKGDEGGKHVVQENSDKIQYLSLDDEAILQDIDTPEDLERFNSR